MICAHILIHGNDVATYLWLMAKERSHSYVQLDKNVSFISESAPSVSGT